MILKALSLLLLDAGPWQNTDVAVNLLHCLTIDRKISWHPQVQNEPISTIIIATLKLFSISKCFWSYLTARTMLGTANTPRLKATNVLIRGGGFYPPKKFSGDVLPMPLFKTLTLFLTWSEIWNPAYDYCGWHSCPKHAKGFCWWSCR